MFGEGVVDLLIGLSLLYFILSLTCSAINEMLASMLQWRGRFLFQGISNLMGGEMAGRLYDHPLIRGLSRKETGRHPSYIPASAFASAVIDILTPADRPQPGARAKKTSSGDLFAGVSDDELRRSLTALWDKAEGRFDEFRHQIESWFNDAMDRVGGWYRRHVQLVLLGIAIVVVGLLNADTIRVAQTLWTTPTARAAVVAQADKVSAPPANQRASVRETVEAFQALPLPLGWSAGTENRLDPRRLPTTIGQGFIKALGLILTAIALTLGAPFWFDVLKKVSGIRIAGSPPTPQTGSVKQ